MDHGHSDMPMARCSMNMLWNTQIINTCIVFRSWHISSNSFFLVSCLIIVALGVLYEYLRVAATKLDRRIAVRLAARGAGSSVANAVSREAEDSSEEESLIGRVSKARKGTPVPTASRLARSVLYGATVFLSFFIMLIFMTYNAYLIASVVIGAAMGHYLFGATMDVDAVLNGVDGMGRPIACH